MTTRTPPKPSPLDRARIHRAMPMGEAVRTLDVGRVGILVITDDAGALLGTLTDGDIRRAILAGRPFHCSAAEFLRGKDNPVYPEPIWLPDTASSEQMLAVMTDRKNVPVRTLLKQDGNDLILFVVNIEAQPVDVQFGFVSEVAEAVLLAGAPDNMKRVGSQLHDRLVGFGTRVYRLRLRAS